MVPPPPLPNDSFEVVRIDSLAAALVKLNINITIGDLVKVIREEEEAKRVKMRSAAQVRLRRAALSNLALQPTVNATGLKITTVGKFNPKPNY